MAPKSGDLLAKWNFHSQMASKIALFPGLVFCYLHSGSPLEGSGNNTVPWWDNEDSNNSTFGLPTPKGVSDLGGEDGPLSGILNGLNNLGKHCPWDSQEQVRAEQRCV